MVLKNNSRVHIVGGGPAGSFFAIHLLNEARKAGRKIKVIIIEKKIVGELHDRPCRKLTGCNFCAGVISPRLLSALDHHQIRLPEEIICEQLTHIWIHGNWKNFPFKVPAGQTLCATFRGSLPQDRGAAAQGLDAFLLREAVKSGADLMPGNASAIQYSTTCRPRLCVSGVSGCPVVLDSEFVCIATGINSHPAQSPRDNPFLESYRKINPSFKPPGTRQALVVELKPGNRYLKKYMGKELYLIVSGTKDLNIEHAVMVPKGAYLTIVLMGKSIDTACFPGDAEGMMKRFLSLPQVQSILPQINLAHCPISCMCYPQMVGGVSDAPCADRIALIGDALGSRLYRDGLYSAFVCAEAMAETVIHGGVEQKRLNQAADRIIHWLKRDNAYCRIVFILIQTFLKSGLLSRVFYQTFASEMKFRKREAWPLGQILWEIGSGGADYKAVFKKVFSPPVLGSFLCGGARTLRNILTEVFFGLTWGPYGRYPTVILREKRDFFKQSIQAPLGIKLDDTPHMERMYAIKIRASSKAIFEELGRFGEENAKFLKLRFVDVRRTQGDANKAGAVVQYRLKVLPIAMDIHLTHVLSNKTLLYEPEELFAERGILLFDIRPTKDGNNRLVIYTAFDFRSGNTYFEKLFFRIFRCFFPEYAHYVVWNHALCTIKAQAERPALS